MTLTEKLRVERIIRALAAMANCQDWEELVILLKEALKEAQALLLEEPPLTPSQAQVQAGHLAKKLSEYLLFQTDSNFRVADQFVRKIHYYVEKGFPFEEEGSDP